MKLFFFTNLIILIVITITIKLTLINQDNEIQNSNTKNNQN